MNYLRRGAGIKKARKVLRVMRAGATLNPGFYADDGDWAKKLLKTRVLCSKPCCGNPRKWYGKPTLQEQRADLQLSDDW